MIANWTIPFTRPYWLGLSRAVSCTLCGAVVLDRKHDRALHQAKCWGQS